jgi:polysaccharide biosynthesis protein PslG
MRLIYENDLRPVITIGAAPPWARRPEWQTECPIEDKVCTYPPQEHYADAFGEFAKAVMQRYPAVAYELWNEPNAPRFWPQPDPYLYLVLLRVTARAKDELGLEAPLIVGGLAPGGEGDGDALEPEAFLDYLYQHGEREWFDGIGYHPYPGTAGSWVAQFTERLRAIRGIQRKHDDEGTPLWLTEIGLPSKSTATPNGAPAGNQGEILHRLYRLSENFNTAAFLIYRLYEDPSEGPRWEPYGVTHGDLRPKPAYIDLKRLMSQP